jgi:serine protease AprX
MSAGEDVWADRAHCALGALASMAIPATPQVLREMVAARFAAQFDERDRL